MDSVIVDNTSAAVDWSLIKDIFLIFFSLLCGAWINRTFIERRAKLLAYIGHIAEFDIQEQTLSTHSVVLINAGKVAANNVRVQHKTLPEFFQIKPPLKYLIEDIDDGGKDIVFEKLIPNDEITIHYLYSSTKGHELGIAEIHRGIRSDEGYAQVLNVLPSRQYPQWAIRLLAVLTVIGLATIVYSVFKLVEWVIRLSDVVG